MTATRHAWIDTLCVRLERIVLGRLADELLAGDLPEEAALVVAPVWRWLEPRINVGRKGRSLDGSTLLLPVRMTWQAAPLMLVTEPVVAAWSMVGMGHSGSGEVTLVPCVGAPARTGDDFPTDGELGVPPLSKQRLRTALTRISADGALARWDALMSLEYYVSAAVRHAIVSVSYDVCGDGPDATPAWVLDATGSQGVTDRMLLGSGDRPGRVDALIERCLAPSTFVRVDPLKYVITDLHRSAEAEVRKTIGDPHIGRKIRAVRRSMPSASIADVIDAYRLAHPGDHLSTARAGRALTAGPDAMSTFSGVDDLVMAVPSHEDAVVARVDSSRLVSAHPTRPMKLDK